MGRSGVGLSFIISIVYNVQIGLGWALQSTEYNVDIYGWVFQVGLGMSILYVA